MAQSWMRGIRVEVEEAVVGGRNVRHSYGLPSYYECSCVTSTVRYSVENYPSLPFEIPLGCGSSVPDLKAAKGKSQRSGGGAKW